MTELTDTVLPFVQQIIKEAWREIHARRLDADEDGFKGPDNFYHGVQVARDIVGGIGRRYGLSDAELHHD